MMQRFSYFLLFIMLFTSKIYATDFELALTDLAQAKDRSALINAIQQLGSTGDERGIAVLEALENNNLRVTDTQQLVILSEALARFVLTDETVEISTLTLRQLPQVNNAVRRALRPAVAKLQLNSPHIHTRLAAAEELRKRPPDGAAELLNMALAKEENAKVKKLLMLALAQVELNSGNETQRLAAIALLGEQGNIDFTVQLKELLKQNDSGDFIESTAVRTAAQKALAQIEAKEDQIALFRNLFYGISLGSILLLAALGLAITFGLMGVINMAHGEMLMLGAYSTYVVQNIFKDYLPASLFDGYLIVALPVAFIVSASVGILLERTVIRHLYGRPLETLLATWGISLILIQTVRVFFGAQNVQVANPSWLSGGWEVASNFVIPYNRIAIILFVIMVVVMVWLILQRTVLGLQVRAVTQNRNMAACMGIPTRRVDMWTFGLGSGVAGLGGVALSQIGNVGPELGQGYIVDSFMVVVLGGVGKIAGTVTGALGLGVVTKFLEPEVGAVLAKIMVLILIILFIQKRPQGIFALKGRFAES
ncbi:urea ABC transporter permease subunit UrtB [Thioflexithrix psekupsensis]|nr:urea ABC transporter permease subunit UrtB [Thioflexithrix psekupsensis]